MATHPPEKGDAKNKVEGIYAVAGEQLLGGFCLSLSTWCTCVACDRELFQQLKLLRARAAGRVGKSDSVSPEGSTR